MTITRTADPEWLTTLDARCRPLLENLFQLPIIKDAASGKFGRDAGKAEGFFTQVGVGIIAIFPKLLDNMLTRAAKKSSARAFFRLNRREEQFHWKWWYLMAAAYGVQRERFENIELSPNMSRLFQYLTFASKNWELPLAIAVVNYVIETAAAQMTAEIADALKMRLRGDSYRWVEAHRSGDIEHSHTARQLLKLYVGDDVNLQQQVSERVMEAYQLFHEALSEAYSG